MKILYVPSLNVGVCYWRIENYAEEMLKLYPTTQVFVKYFFDPRENIAWDKVCTNHGETSDQIQFELSEAFRYFDAIIFQKLQSKGALELINEYRQKYPETKVLAEIDDSIGEITPSNSMVMDFGDAHRWAAEHCAQMDGVICATEYLANSVKKFNKKTFVAPNCIQSESWKPELKEAIPKTVGYVAAGGHDEDLLIAYRAMLPLLEEDPELKFIIKYGAIRPKFLKKHKQISFEAIGWKFPDYPQKLADLQLSLALAPLRDTEFNRCKSNLKWVEWSSLGVPLVASDVEPYKNTQGKITLSSNDIPKFTLNIKRALSDLTPLDPELALVNYTIRDKTKALVDWITML
jgi:glycosyltransferase involved in cell wall biosynthesis